MDEESTEIGEVSQQKNRKVKRKIILLLWLGMPYKEYKLQPA